MLQAAGKTRPSTCRQQVWQCRLGRDVLASHLEAGRLGRMECIKQKGTAAKQLHVLQASQQHAAVHSRQSAPHLEGRPLYPIMHRSLRSTPPSVLARWYTTALRGNTIICRHQEAVASARNRCSEAGCMSQQAGTSTGRYTRPKWSGRCFVLVSCLSSDQSVDPGYLLICHR